ncbi:MAG: hypothetical protein Hyperionvirus2_48 [Hyperionvirus sp.]|uniref:Uncharacterized protein n=1 Tax=Hyperionvirus sp. TaxID=2487770 RepID=A0A3G5A5Z3_9VIRU|nr:MAG: hypothetical protein Hyperionvirus2_48 [Hyperionvirus sp.]
MEVCLREIILKLYDAFDAGREVEIDEIAHLLIANPQGLVISYEKCSREMIRRICEFAALRGRIDIMVYFEKYLSEGRKGRYLLMACAAAGGADNVVRYFLGEGMYPSNEGRNESLEVEVNWYCRVAFFAASSDMSKLDRNGRVKIILELFEADPGSILGDRRNLYILAESAVIFDLSEIVEIFVKHEVKNDRYMRDLVRLIATATSCGAKGVFCLLENVMIKLVSELEVVRIYDMECVYPFLKMMVRKDRVEGFEKIFSILFRKEHVDWGGSVGRLCKLVGEMLVSNSYRIMAYVLSGGNDYGSRLGIDVKNSLERLELGQIEMFEVLLVGVRVEVTPPKHYVVHYLDPRKNFDRCYFLQRKGVRFDLVEGFRLAEFKDRVRKYQKLIMEVVCERNVKINKPTGTNLGIFNIIMDCIYDRKGVCFDDDEKN